MTKSDRSLESLCSGKIRLFYPLLSIITFKCNILVFFKIIIWTMSALTIISTIAAVTLVSAVEMCFTTLASVGRTYLSLAQPHFTNCSTASGAGGKLVITGSHLLSCNV